ARCSPKGREGNGHDAPSRGGARAARRLRPSRRDRAGRRTGPADDALPDQPGAREGGAAMIDWTARANAILAKAPYPPTAGTDETPILSVLTVPPRAFPEKT